MTQFHYKTSTVLARLTTILIFHWNQGIIRDPAISESRAEEQNANVDRVQL